MEKRLTKREKLLEKKNQQTQELFKINEEIKLELEKERKRTLSKISGFIKKIELLDQLNSLENLNIFLGGILKLSDIVKRKDVHTKEVTEYINSFHDFELQFKNKKLEETVIKNEE